MLRALQVSEVGVHDVRGAFLGPLISGDPSIWEPINPKPLIIVNP